MAVFANFNTLAVQPSGRGDLHPDSTVILFRFVARCWGAGVATWRAISAVSGAAKAVLESARAPAGLSSVPIELFQPAQLATPLAEAVSLTLYRVAINQNQRTPPPRVTPGGRRYRPSLPVDLHYLLTAWGRTPERQHELMGWAMRTLEDAPVLPAALLNQGQATPVFRSDEAVDILAAPVTQQEMVAIWEVAKSQMQLSMTYVARAVSLDSEIEMGAPTLVRSREGTVAQRREGE